MVAYNFISQFADAVESGEKVQTIRKRGKKRHARVGDRIQLYTGMQTKSCKLLRVGVCIEFADINIFRDESGHGVKVYLGGLLGFVCLHENQIEQFSKNDGVKSIDDFFDYFLPNGAGEFDGHVIRWKLLPLGGVN